MCNLYAQLRTIDAIRRLFAGRGWRNDAGNLEPGSVYPDRMGPVLRLDGEIAVLEQARWGLPSPPKFHSPSGIDRGVTNVRNAASPHWRRWLGPEFRCLVPFTRFAEPRPGKGAGNAWFGFADDRPAFFAGIRVPDWRSIRKLKDGETTDTLFAFLTTDPNAEVGAIHPKAMPAILITPEEWQLWLTAPWAAAAGLQRPLPDHSLVLIEDDPD